MPVSKNTPVNGEEAAPKKEVRHVLGIKDASQLPTKRTINLCIREKKGMSAEMFLIIIAAILAVFILVELVGIFIPYKKVERLESELASAQSVLDEKLDRLKDYDEVEEFYNRYTYKDFDRTLADRLDVLGILEKYIMNDEEFKDIAKIRGISIEGKTVSVEIEGLNEHQIGTLHLNLIKDPLVESVTERNSSVTDNSDVKIPTMRFTILLKDASTVKTAEEGKV